MTDENGPEKPEIAGMAEVSAKFLHEAEVATAAPPSSASTPTDSLVTLGEQWQKAYDDWQASMPPRGDGEEWTAQDDERSMKLARITWGLEDQISKLPVLSLNDALVKIRIAEAYEVEHFGNRHAELTRQARNGLERLVVSSVTPATSDDEFLALEPRMIAASDTFHDLEAKGAPREETAPVEEKMSALEHRVACEPVTTPAGIAAKFRLVAEGIPADLKTQLDQVIIQSALECAERMAREGAAVVPTVTVREERGRILKLWDAYKEAGAALTGMRSKYLADGNMEAVATEDKAAEADTAAFAAIVNERCHTLGGVLGKMSVLKGEAAEVEMSMELFDAIVRDLERLAPVTAVTEIPPTEDAAFFDALAEYDRLRTVSRGLERHKEIFRPGIPEAQEAETAYESAYDNAYEAWTRARNIPTTTQVGLFAKLQAIIRFMDDLQEDEMYETEWHAIKADMQRITGEARP